MWPKAISVEDQLPESKDGSLSEPVLVFDLLDEQWVVAQYGTIGWDSIPGWHIVASDCEYVQLPTHWLKLPHPPSPTNSHPALARELSDTQLPKRFAGLLQKQGITTLEHLASVTEQDVLCISGFGERGLLAIRDLLAEHGLRMSNVRRRRVPFAPR